MKALSTILSTVILVVIVITIYAILTTFSTTLFKEQQVVTTNRTNEAVKCSFSNVVIKDVYIDMIGNIARIHIQNEGQTDESIDSVFIYNKNGENIHADGMPVSIRKNDIKTIEISVTGFIGDCDDFDKVTATTTCSETEFLDMPSC
jgi:hypothetical protein